MRLGGVGVVLVFCAACGGGSAPEVDAAVAPDTFVPPPDAAPCNTIADVATDVAEVGVAEAAPGASGGTIVDGTYVVTASVIYTGVGGQAGTDGNVIHATSVNTAGQYQYVDTGTNAALTSGRFQTSGTSTITVLQDCPTQTVINFGTYTASPTEFTLYDRTNPAAVAALTFTLQP
jgi:hypothetical protein